MTGVARRLLPHPVLLAVALSLLGPAGLHAEIDAGLQAAGWTELAFSGKQANRFSAAGTGVQIDTDSSASLIFREAALDPVRTPCLAWRWTVNRPVPPTDLSREGGDDRSIALWVGFRFDREAASFTERLAFDARQALSQSELPGRTLLYVWGGLESGGLRSSPYLRGRGAYRILRSATTETEVWLREAVNLATDYEQAFGQPATAVVQIAISADSDDTATSTLR